MRLPGAFIKKKKKSVAQKISKSSYHLKIFKSPTFAFYLYIFLPFLFCPYHFYLSFFHIFAYLIFTMHLPIGTITPTLDEETKPRKF